MASENRQERPVRLYTLAGVLDGSLLASPRLRTLDQLNLEAVQFVTLHDPRVVHGSWGLDAGPLTLNKSMILFALETAPPPPLSARGFGSFTRAAVRLRITEFGIQGFVHVAPGGEPMKRLEQNKHAFLSVTSALVSGPAGDFPAPFLAINRHHVVIGQRILVPADAEVGSVDNPPGTSG